MNSPLFLTLVESLAFQSPFKVNERSNKKKFLYIGRNSEDSLLPRLNECGRSARVRTHGCIKFTGPLISSPTPKCWPKGDVPLEAGHGILAASSKFFVQITWKIGSVEALYVSKRGWSFKTQLHLLPPELLPPGLLWRLPLLNIDSKVHMGV